MECTSYLLFLLIIQETAKKTGEKKAGRFNGLPLEN
jgi:hypothetical protein